MNIICLGDKEKRQQRSACSREPASLPAPRVHHRKDACLCSRSLQTTQESEPPTLTEMFIKIELQNNGSEHNVLWSRMFLN